jgi:hypothetical protein
MKAHAASTTIMVHGSMRLARGGGKVVTRGGKDGRRESSWPDKVARRPES